MRSDAKLLTSHIRTETIKQDVATVLSKQCSSICSYNLSQHLLGGGLEKD